MVVFILTNVFLSTDIAILGKFIEYIQASCSG